MLRTRELADLGVKITVLQTPEGMSASRGLKRLRKLDPDGTYDYNHVYLDSGAERQAQRRAAAAESPAIDSGTGRVGTHRWRRRRRSTKCSAGIRIHHDGCDGKLVPSPHGTAVAHLLVSRNGIGEIFRRRCVLR